MASLQSGNQDMEGYFTGVTAGMLAVWMLYQGVNEFKAASKGTVRYEIERLLPFQGRWLRYGAAIFTVLTGILCLFVAGMSLVLQPFLRR